MRKIILILIILFITSTLQAQWYYTQLMAATNSVTFVNSSTGFASTGFTLAKSTDGGTTWNMVASVSDGDSIFINMHFPSETTGYAVGLSGNIMKTTDGGNNWFHLTPGTTENLWSVFFTDEMTGYVAGDNHTLVKTTDGGITWQTLSSPVGLTWSMYFINSNLGFIAGNVRSIYRTQDGGVNWLEIAFPTPNKFLAIHFPNENTGYACGMKDALTPCMLKSTDGGMKWDEISVNAGKGLQAIFFLDDNTGYAAGVGGTIIKTTDGGQNWGTQSTPDLGTFYSICFTDHNHGFAGGAALVRTDNGGGPQGIFEPIASASVSIAPNPARKQVTVTTEINGEKGDLTIINQNGSKVLEMKQCEFPHTMDISGLVPGIYVVRIDGEKKNYSGKLIKL